MRASFRGMLRKKSLTIGRSFAGSVGGYLPSTLTEIWDPQRDFAFLKLPVAGVRTIVALSRCVLSCCHFLVDVRI